MPTMAKKRTKPGKTKNPWPGRLEALRELLADKLGRPINQTEAAKLAEIPYRTWTNWEDGLCQPSSASVRLLYLIFPELKTIK